MNVREKEIRRILNGYYQLNDEYRIEAGEDLRDLQQLRGSLFSTFLFGLKKVKRQYLSELSEEDLPYELADILEEHGSPTDLHTAPEAFALFVSSGISKEYLLTAEVKGKAVLFTLYSSRGLFMRWRLGRQLRKWEERLEPLKLKECPLTMETGGSRRKKTKNRQKNEEKKK